MPDINYTDVSRFRQSILDLIGNAPESADTLGELYNLITNLPNTTVSFDGIEQNIFSMPERRTYYPSGDYRAGKLFSKEVGGLTFRYFYEQKTVGTETRVVLSAVQAFFTSNSEGTGIPDITKRYYYASSFEPQSINYSNLSSTNMAAVIAESVGLVTHLKTGFMSIADKIKLDGLEELFLGQFVSLASLKIAYPSPNVGSYAFVDMGLNAKVATYLWDSSDQVYRIQLSDTVSIRPDQVKSLYESNPDTNPFTDSDKALLFAQEITTLGQFRREHLDDLTANGSVILTTFRGSTFFYISFTGSAQSRISIATFQKGDLIRLDGGYTAKVTGFSNFTSHVILTIVPLDGTPNPPAIGMRPSVELIRTAPTRAKLDLTKQDKLTAGANIAISDNTISFNGILSNDNIPFLLDNKVPSDIVRSSQLTTQLTTQRNDLQAEINLKQNNIVASTPLDLSNGVLGITGTIDLNNLPSLPYAKLPNTIVDTGMLTRELTEKQDVLQVGKGLNISDNIISSTLDGFHQQLFLSSGTWDWEAAGRPARVKVYLIGGGGGGQAVSTEAGVAQAGGSSSFGSIVQRGGTPYGNSGQPNHPAGKAEKKHSFYRDVYVQGGGAGYAGGGAVLNADVGIFTAATKGLVGGVAGTSFVNGGSGGVFLAFYYLSVSENMPVIVGNGGDGGGYYHSNSGGTSIFISGGQGGVDGDAGVYGRLRTGGGGGSGAVLVIW